MPALPAAALPEEQQVEPVVREGARVVVAPDGGAEVRSSRDPALDLAVVRILTAVGGHLDVASGAPTAGSGKQGAAADTLAGDGVGADRGPRDGVRLGPADRVVGVDAAGDEGGADRRRGVVRPDVALDVRSPAWIGHGGGGEGSEDQREGTDNGEFPAHEGSPFSDGETSLRWVLLALVGAAGGANVTGTSPRPSPIAP